MLHPFIVEDYNIEATLELCTIIKGMPYGPAIISY
jgi:hypothetical protein